MQYRSTISSSSNANLGERDCNARAFLKKRSARAERREAEKEIRSLDVAAIHEQDVPWDMSWEVSTYEEKGIRHRMAYFAVGRIGDVSVFCNDLVVMEQTFYRAR